MISNFATVVFFVLIACCVSFLVYSLNEKKHMQLIKKLYIALCTLVIEWSLVMIGMRFTSPDSTRALFVLDSLSYIAACTAPPTMLLIADLPPHLPCLRPLPHPPLCLLSLRKLFLKKRSPRRQHLLCWRMSPRGRWDQISLPASRGYLG